MSVWLIGNRGMLGSEVEYLLKQEQTQYLATDRNIDIADFQALMTYRQANISKKIRWIVNCSGYTAVDRAEDESELAFRVNADGVFNIAQAAKMFDSSVIHISTDYVFNGLKSTPYTEDDQPDPLQVYGHSKLKGEQLLRQTTDRHFILRTSWLYGKYGNNFPLTMLRLFGKKDTVSVVSDQWGSPTYARDLAGVITRIIRNGSLAFGTYHYTNEGKTNWYEFAEEIYRLSMKRGLCNRQIRFKAISTAEFASKTRRPTNSYLSKEKIKNKLGENIRSWQAALGAFFDELKSKS